MLTVVLVASFGMALLTYVHYVKGARTTLSDDESTTNAGAVSSVMSSTPSTMDTIKKDGAVSNKTKRRMAAVTTTKILPPRSSAPKKLLCSAETPVAFLQDRICDYVFLVRGSSWLLRLDSLKRFRDFCKMLHWTKCGLDVSPHRGFPPWEVIRTLNRTELLQPVWDDNIHHFGVLDINPLYGIVHATEIIQILKLKQLELKRSSNIEAYTFLAVILPLPPPDFDILKRAVGLGDIDFLIAKTHTNKGGTNTHDCEGMGPTVYNVSLAKRQVSMVEALEDVRSQASSFRNTRLMVSFTLSILKYTPADSICPKFGPISWLCDAQLVNQTAPRLLTTQMFKTLFDLAFDDSVTINWKICNSMRRFPGLNFGVALYNLEDDDSSRTSCLNASTESRLPAVSNYFRKFASKPEFGTTKNVDCGDLLSNVGTDG